MSDLASQVRFAVQRSAWRRISRKARVEIQFIGIARGSLAEVETHLLIAHRLGYLTADHVQPVFADIERIARMLSVLATRLKQRQQR